MPACRIIDEDFETYIKDDKVLVLYGARQVGKSTFMRQFVQANSEEALYLNCDQVHIMDTLHSRNIARIAALFGKHRFICLDEVQTIEEVLDVLLLLKKQLSQYKMVVSSSASFELMEVSASLLEQHFHFINLYPLSLKELQSQEDWMDTESKFPLTLVYGLYPHVYDTEISDKQQALAHFTDDMLFKDLWKQLDIRQSTLLRKVLKAVAFNIGRELPINHLAKELKVARMTIERYLDILEKSFIIFSLNSYNRKLSNELKKSKKYYFFDNGLRNTMINNFNHIEHRSDAAQLWENFCVSEIIKQASRQYRSDQFYFWRTYDQAEIDLVLENKDHVDIWDFKWKPRRKPKFPRSFMTTYVIGNQEFVTPKELQTFLN